MKRVLKILRLEIELLGVLIIGLIFIIIDKIRNLPITPSNNILFIQVYGIGNFILSSTMQSAVRGQTLNMEFSSKFHIQGLTPPKIFAIVHPAIKELADKSPYIDEVIVYQDRRLLGKIKLINQLRKTNFALAIDLSGTYWTAWLTRLSRAPKRIGFNAVGVKRLWFNQDGSGGLYNLSLPFNYDMHMKEFYEKFLTILNIPLKDKELKIFQSKEDDKFATQVIREFSENPQQPIVVVHIGARQKERLWGIDKFAQLISNLLKKNANVILAGSNDDIERGNKILSLLNNNKKVISIVGKTTLYQLASIISKSHLFIGHDSGPMHIACAVKTKVVALFGPGVVELWRPWQEESVVVQSQVPCRGCNKIGHFYNCKENICMSKISVKEVLNAVETLIFSIN